LRRLTVAVGLALVCAACGGTHVAKPKKVTGEPGFRLSVHGHDLYYECAGPTTSPAIVLEAGLGGDHRSWSFVQPLLARTTRTCSYDRAWLGLSPPYGTGRTGHDQVDDLHELLREAHVDPPYVLVGHSYGGLLVHEFASAHPSEVAGVVLVDSAHPLQAARFLAALGGPKPGEPLLESKLRNLLKEVPPNDEGLDVRASFREAQAAHTLGDTPLVVITAGIETDPSVPLELRTLLDRTWLSLQSDLAGLSTNSIHVIAAQSPHAVMSPLGQPSLVFKAIREVVEATRTNRLLPPCTAVFAPPGARCVP